MNLRQKPLLFVFRLAAGLVFLLLVGVAAVFTVMYVTRANIEPLLPVKSALQSVYYEPKLTLDYNDLSISKRPLFWESRRPVVVADAVDLEPVVTRSYSKLDDVILLGVMGAGESAYALISQDGSNHKIQVGESLSGWELQEVLPTAAIFMLDDSDFSKPKVKKLEMNVRPPLSEAWKSQRELDLILNNH